MSKPLSSICWLLGHTQEELQGQEPWVGVRSLCFPGVALPRPLPTLGNHVQGLGPPYPPQLPGVCLLARSTGRGTCRPRGVETRMAEGNSGISE